MIDYERIREDNSANYGKLGASKYGKRMSQDLYADQTHFIYELLQNAEDALGRRPSDWHGERAVSFTLADNHLRVIHNGDPFNEGDVRAICEFDESTKKESLTDIGRFGVGFKSVYAFTDRPEIYSNKEHFAIEDYIYPFKTEPIQYDNPDATVFHLPFREDVPSAGTDIARGLEDLNRRTLLFLKHIDEISWEICEDRSGTYLRESKEVDQEIRRVTLVFDEPSDKDTQAEEWLVFSRVVKHDNTDAGNIQIAYLLRDEDDKIIQATDGSIFARFDTEVGTGLGVLIDGPYKTTLSRDNVPGNDDWNQNLVVETASLLVDSLRWLRQHNKLDAETLCCLPLRYPSKQILLPLYEELKRVLLSEEPFLPQQSGGYISAKHGVLANTDDLRELLSNEQIAELFEGKTGWIDKTLEKSTNLLDYLKETLQIAEIRPERIVNRLSKSFLEQQTDQWIQSLYVFFNPQRAQFHRLKAVPIVRLEDGSHVLPTQKRIFVPNEADTDYATVRRSVCQEEDARELLTRLGLRKWDDVDDVVENILPRYLKGTSKIDEGQYRKDICRLVDVWRSSDEKKLKRLEDAIKSTPLVRCVEGEDFEQSGYACPPDTYVYGEDIIKLFGGLRGIRFTDPVLDKIAGQPGMKMLIQCGVRDILQPNKVQCIANYGQWRPAQIRFNEDDLMEMRKRTSEPKITPDRTQSLIDWQIADIEQLIEAMPKMDLDDTKKRAKTMWTMLANIDRGAFEGKYEWFFRKTRTQTFPSKFVDYLNTHPWVPDLDGELRLPIEVEFDSLGWQRYDWLLTHISFKPEVLNRALEQMGYTPGWSQFIIEAEEMGKLPGDFQKSMQKESEPIGPSPGQGDISILAHL